MSSNVSVYTSSMMVEDLSGNELFETDKENQVTMNDVDASDFVSEFMVSEVLDAMDFSDVVDYVAKRQGESDEDWS